MWFQSEEADDSRALCGSGFAKIFFHRICNSARLGFLRFLHSEDFPVLRGRIFQFWERYFFALDEAVVPWHTWLEYIISDKTKGNNQNQADKSSLRKLGDLSQGSAWRMLFPPYRKGNSRAKQSMESFIAIKYIWRICIWTWSLFCINCQFIYVYFCTKKMLKILHPLIWHTTSSLCSNWDICKHCKSSKSGCKTNQNCSPC